MNQFSERISTLSNENLLKILDERMDYQPEAIQAVKNELENRNLSESEITEIKVKKVSERKINKKALIKLIETRDNEKMITDEIPDIYNPLSKGTFIIKIFTLITFYAWFLLNGITDISIDIQILLTLFVISVIQLLRKKNSGWIILAWLITCNTLICLYITIYDIVEGVKIKPFIFYDYRYSVLLLIKVIPFWLFINSKYFTKHLEISKKTQLITYVSSALFIAIAILTGLITER